jgi:hypothetical protein
MNDAGGWLWLIIDVGMVVALGAVLAYGAAMYHHRRRNRRNVTAPEYKENKR